MTSFSTAGAFHEIASLCALTGIFRCHDPFLALHLVRWIMDYHYRHSRDFVSRELYQVVGEAEFNWAASSDNVTVKTRTIWWKLEKGHQSELWRLSVMTLNRR